MILEGLFNLLFAIPASLIGFMPQVDFSISGLVNANAFHSIITVINYALYFVDIEIVSLCFYVVFNYYMIRLGWAIILRIKSFIPLLSST